LEVPTVIHFLGSSLDIEVDRVLARDDTGPSVFTGYDFTGHHLLVAEAAVAPGAGRTWICAPQSERAIECVASGQSEVISALRHSLDGSVEIVAITGSDRWMRCDDLDLVPMVAGHLPHAA